MKTMSLLRNKRVVILGLGNHGGGIASAQFACYSAASHVLISDMQSEDKLKNALKQLTSVLQLPHVELETGTHSLEKILNADVLIKNPAIPRSSPLMRACRERGVTIETDISLFLRALIARKKAAAKNAPCKVVAITGTKGKSSMTRAIHMWNLQCGVASAAAGNITYSPLQLLMDERTDPSTSVLELSSFQLGDLQLVQQSKPAHSLYQPISLAILTNILPDHQNYYASMREYVEDKLSLFRALPQDAPIILPYELQKGEQREALGDLQTTREHAVFWHSQSALPDNLAGAWATETSIMLRSHAGEKAYACCALAHIPKHLPLQNCIAFVLSCALQKLPFPRSAEAWKDIFTLPHRKEHVRNYKGRSFYNDSAASIPQAMQLRALQERAHTHVHLIAGGTDKNLDAHSFLHACSAIAPTQLTLHLLEGSYTEKIMPLIGKLGCGVFGPFASLEEGIQSALDHSKAGDVIALSPGCTSFGSFLNEFHRGEVFKGIVHALA